MLRRKNRVGACYYGKDNGGRFDDVQFKTGYSGFPVYGHSKLANVMFTYEYQPFHSEWLGNVGAVFGIGLTYHRGNGRFQFNLENPAAAGPTTVIPKRGVLGPQAGARTTTPS